MMKTRAVCALVLCATLTITACARDEPVNSADTPVETAPLPFAHPSFRESLPDPGAFHNEVVLAYVSRRRTDVPLTPETFVDNMTASANEVLAARGRPPVVTREDIGVLFSFFVDLRDAGIYDVFDVDESPSRLVAYLYSTGALTTHAAEALEFFIDQSDLAGGDIADPSTLIKATLAISSDPAVHSFLELERASSMMWDALLPSPKGTIPMKEASAMSLMDAVAGLAFVEFGPYAAILSGTLASTLYREALGDNSPLPPGGWRDLCTPCW